MRNAGLTRLFSTILALILLFSLPACGAKPASAWQEQYDLGVRYLSEGNYKEAILAFTAAIDIDPKQADAYVKLADVYTAQGNKTKAAEVLTQALSAVGENEAVSAALAALDIAPSGSSNLSGQPGEPLPLAPVAYSQRAELGGGWYNIYEFDAEGRLVRFTQYNPGGAADYMEEYFYDANGIRVAQKITMPGREDILYIESRLDLLGRDTETTKYETTGHIHKFTYLYEGTTVTVGAELTAPDGKTAAGSFVHTLLNAENELQRQGYSWSFDDGQVDSIVLREYDRTGFMVASVTFNEDRWTGEKEQLLCRYEGATVHMTYTGTVDDGTDTVSMVYTMSSPDNFISEGQSTGWQKIAPAYVTEVSFSEVGTYTGEWTRIVYDVETNTFSKAEN